MFRVLLALSLFSTIIAAPSQTVSTPAPALPVCGANEYLVAVGGGCYIGVDGVQQCASPKPPTCQCASGFQRNATTKKCEKSVTSVRAGRSISDTLQKNCSGPNEHLVALGGGCYVDVTGKQVCAPPQPPSCVCASGFERNPTNKVCEAVSSVQKTKL